MKKLRNQDREVKFLENFREFKKTDFDLSERVHLEVISFLYVICQISEKEEEAGVFDLVGMEVDEGSEVGATEREEYYEDLEDEHSDEEGEDD